MLDAIEELRRQIETLTQHIVQNQVPSNDGVGSEEEGYHHEEEFVNRFHKKCIKITRTFFLVIFYDRCWNNELKVKIPNFGGNLIHNDFFIGYQPSRRSLIQSKSMQIRR